MPSLVQVLSVLVLDFILSLLMTKLFQGGGGGGGGCVYNPNAPARFDMGFILLMVLSAYYLIRRKRRFV
jgi:hypothetical protein